MCRERHDRCRSKPGRDADTGPDKCEGMVEAAGVEPASEGTSPKDSTCVSASLISRPSCESGEKPTATSLSKSHNRAPRRHQIASPFNGVQAPTTGRGREGRSQRIRLRERTDYPQLTDVPSDLRVNGARHASRESLPPSKPSRPRTGQNRRGNTHVRCVLSRSF